MSRGGRKSMMRIMPAFPHAKDAEQGIVPALIIAVIRLRTQNVTDCVNAPSNMVNEKDPHQTAPYESRPRPAGRPNEQPSERCWDQQARHYPQPETKRSRRGAICSELGP